MRTHLMLICVLQISALHGATPKKVSNEKAKPVATRPIESLVAIGAGLFDMGISYGVAKLALKATTNPSEKTRILTHLIALPITMRCISVPVTAKIKHKIKYEETTKKRIAYFMTLLASAWYLYRH